ncbi:MAG: outer membrane beta-barrel protein [Siphonobacter sp.]
MKTIRFYSSIALVALLATFSFSSFAQVGFTLHGTMAAPNLDGAEAKPGVGAGLKAFLGKNVAVGVAAKYISLSYDYDQSVGNNLDNKGSLVPLTGTLDIYLTRGAVRPYIGGEAGAYIRTIKVNLAGEQIAKETQTKFGAAPKVGVAFALGGVGLFAEGSYNFIFGSKDGSANTGSVSNISWENPSKLWAVNVGVTFGFPRTNN